MFHDILPETEARGGGAERFAVSRDRFEQTLDTITRTGYLGCSLAEALTQRGRRRVAITFDDGTRGQLEYAVPALRARGMTSTFFVTTDRVGRPGFMSWGDLRQLTAWGMSVQSHTRSHPFLSELDAHELRAELVDSKAALDRELVQQTSQIALPGGDAPARRLRYLLGETGYGVVAGSRWGRNADAGRATELPRTIRRCTVRGDVSEEFLRRVISGDPWLALTRRAREATLAHLRSTLGATRYARWRRRVLDVFAGVNP